MPAIRVCLAFVADDNNVQAILNEYDWSKGEINLRSMAIQSSQIKDKLFKIVNHPEKYLSINKIEQIKEYLLKSEEAFTICFWKIETFKVLT